MKSILFLILTVTLISFRVSGQGEDKVVPFTLADRDRSIRMEVKIDEMSKRFDDVNKRFDDVNKRFDMINSRFDDVNKRIDQTNTYMGWMISAFAAIALAVFGFALWDRRTMIRPFEVKVKEIEANYELKGTKVEKILSSLRELAKTDSKVAEILKNQNLL
jgi:hypothetical protein